MQLIKDDEFIHDIKPRDGILIIDANSQNIMSEAFKTFSIEFPESYGKLLKRLMGGDSLYNNAYPFIERNYTIIVVVSQMNAVGPDADEVIDIVTSVEYLLKMITKKYGHDRTYMSPRLYKDYGAWPQIETIIKKLNLNWRIYAN